MGKLHACFVVAIGALAAACGDDGGAKTIDAAVTPDAEEFMDAMADAAPMFDLNCIGNNPPTPAATVALSGFAQEVDVNLATLSFTQTPIEDADIRACDTIACTGPADDTTDANGDWSIASIAPAEAEYLKMSATGVRTTLVYPHANFAADQAGIPFLTFGTTVAGFIGSFDGCDNAANPLIIVAVTDCANTPISDTANVVLSVKQNNTAVSTAVVHDVADEIPNAPALLAGVFLICGVPAADETEITATYNGMNLLGNTVQTIADGTTSMQIRPGY